MELALIAGSANAALAAAVAAELHVALTARTLERFPDSELHAIVSDPVRGHDVYLLQSTGPPADAHLMELLLLADACRRAGAARVTAVIPYLGYARQDRRSSEGEAVGARVVADLVRALRVNRVVAVDLHAAALEGFFDVPVCELSAVPVLTETLRATVPRRSVVVSPDLGAVKLAERYGAALDLPVAIVRKTRLSGAEVQAHGVVGEVRGLAPLVVDDMISTGGTIEAAIHAVLAAGAVEPVTVAASHGLFVEPAEQRLAPLPIARIVVSNSLALPEGCGLPVEQVSIAALLSEAVRRLHDDRPLDDLLAR